MIDRQALTSKLTYVLPILTFVCGAVLIGAAIYNQMLQGSDPKPDLELSKSILMTQGSMVMALFVLLMSNLVAAIIQGIKKLYQSSMFSLAAASFAMIALIFTMMYDQASIFFQ